MAASEIAPATLTTPLGEVRHHTSGHVLGARQLEHERLGVASTRRRMWRAVLQRPRRDDRAGLVVQCGHTASIAERVDIGRRTIETATHRRACPAEALPPFADLPDDGAGHGVGVDAPSGRALPCRLKGEHLTGSTHHATFTIM
jgi:hypothetical protein